MKKFLVLTSFVSLMMFNFAALAADPLPAGSKVFFVSPKDGATVSTKFTVKFDVSGMKLEKAGPIKAGTGHHHLIIDGGSVPAGQVVAKDATHIHLGNAQTETELTLTPGKHSLTLQFADGAHMSYGPEMAQTITVMVK
jgi:hypothetical protein